MREEDWAEVWPRFGRGWPGSRGTVEKVRAYQPLGALLALEELHLAGGILRAHLPLRARLARKVPDRAPLQGPLAQQCSRLVAALQPPELEAAAAQTSNAGREAEGRAHPLQPREVLLPRPPVSGVFAQDGLGHGRLLFPFRPRAVAVSASRALGELLLHRHGEEGVLEARQAAAQGEEAEARRREAEGGAVGEVVDALEDAKLQLRGQLGQPVRGRGVVVGACTRSSDGGSIAWAC